MQDYNGSDLRKPAASIDTLERKVRLHVLRSWRLRREHNISLLKEMAMEVAGTVGARIVRRYH
jgi:hypothetical protein